MPHDGPLWKLEGFLESLDDWVDRDSPPDDVRLRVTAWILSRYEDPYRGVRRARDFSNLWFGPIPFTATLEGNIVGCAYWIVESERTVRCDRFATLNLPM